MCDYAFFWLRNRFTLVNLYKATEGDLRIIYEILNLGISNNIIVQLAKSNVDTGTILKYLIDQEQNYFRWYY